MERRRLPCSSRGAGRSLGRRKRAESAVSVVGRKVRELRRLVPGGDEMPADRLLLRTADYIVQLRMKVELLRALSNLYMPLPHGDHHTS